MFTAFLKKDVPPNELSGASEAGILVVCQEDLLEWFSRLETGMSVDIVEWCEQRMPTAFWPLDKA
jgi:hypothetical protein